MIEAFGAHMKGSTEYTRGQPDDSRIGGAEVAPKEIGADFHEVHSNESSSEVNKESFQ